VNRLEELNPQFPKVEGAALEELAKAREALLAENSGVKPARK
jgi:hypothetical protein